MTSAPAKSHRHHVVETLHLAWPIIVSRSAMLLLFTFDTLFAGQASSRELAYIGLGTSAQLVLTLVAIGALQTVAVLVSQAIGAGRLAETGAILRSGLLHALLLSAVIVALCTPAEAFFLLVGQDPAIAAMAARVVHVFLWGVPAMLVFATISLFLEATGRPRIGSLLMAAGIVLDIGLNAVFVTGWGGLASPGGAVAAVATSAATRTLVCVAIIAYLIADQRERGDPHGVLAPLSRWWTEWRALGGKAGVKIRHLGLPMGVAQGVESAAFSTMMFIAGAISALALAAHQVMMTYMSLVFMLAIGMAGATAIRVGHAAGSGSIAEVRRAGIIGTLIGTLIPLPVAVAFIAAPNLLGRAFTSDPAVLAITDWTLFVCGFLLAFDACAAVLMGALRGVGDIWVPSILQASAYWIFAVPLGLLLGLTLGWGALGLVFALLAGIVMSVVLLLPRFLRIVRQPIRTI